MYTYDENGSLVETEYPNATTAATEYDARGLAVAATDPAGKTTTYAYDAFGVEKNPSSTDTNPYRYCGEYFDKETGTYYLRARYYNPAIGRFTVRTGFVG